MKCPVCIDVDLAMSERAGVEVDYCPKCRGIWLDRGELDKILQRASTEQVAQGPATPQAAPYQPGYVPPPHDSRRHGSRDDSRDESVRDYQRGQPGQPYHGNKRKSWWMEIFD